MSKMSLSARFVFGLFGLYLASNSAVLANGNVHVSRFWHNHQPLYWPEWNSNGPQNQRGQYAWDSIVLKPSQNYGGISPVQHPENNLTDIFGLDDRKNAYQFGPRNSLTTFSGGGFAMSYSGSLIDNIRQLGGGRHLGYEGNWNDGIRQARRDWQRLDMLGFTYHHSLGPLLTKAVFRKEVQTFKQAWWKAWGGNMDLSDHSKGFFPTEMAYSRHLIDVLVDEGFDWTLVASHHVSRTSPSYNDRANPEGTYNIYSSPPNKADQLSPRFDNASQWWYGEPNPGNAAWNVAPFAYQLHKVQYVNPETGAIKQMFAVPSDDVLSYRYGYANEGIGKIVDHIAPHANVPVIVIPSTDGDNAWGGGSSSWMEATPQLFNASADRGYVKSMPGTFVNLPGNKQNAPLTHIEDGAWIFPEMCYGSPNFLKWIEPPVATVANRGITTYPGTQIDMETPGFALKFFSYAPLMAGANWIETAEQVLRDEGGTVQDWKIATPYDWDGSWTSPNDVELAWHIYLKGLDSGFNYYGGLGNDDEVKPALATKNAIDRLQNFMTSARRNQDRTPPSVLKPQRFPYNPGWFTFGWFNNQPGVDTRFLKRMPSWFYIWTHAYDMNGISTINVKVRIDNDGVNSMSTTHNETYAGGADVGSWITIPMTKRVLPKTRSALNTAAANGQIDYFVFDPAFWPNPVIADYYFVKIDDSIVPGFKNKLLDYYIEATDTKGNIHKSEIQHVWVQDDGTSPSSSVSFSSDPRDCAPLVVTYNAAGGELEGVSPVYQQISFDNGVTYSNRLMTSTGNNTWVYTNAVPDNAPGAIVWFQNSNGSIIDSRNGQNWRANIRDCDAVTGPGTASTVPENPSGCVPVEIRYYPNTGNLASANPVYLHIGRNGWTETADPRPAMTKVGNYWSYTYNTPTNTASINFVFTTQATGGSGQWDNNSGQDWNVSVANCGSSQPPPPPQTVSINPTNPVGCGPITVTYNPSGRNLLGTDPVKIHIGRNGWQDVILPNPNMTKSGSLWTYTYTPAPGTTNISMAFNDGGATWDSNGGADWHFTVTGCAAAPTGLVVTNPPANINVANGSATYDLAGVASGYSGLVRWTNAATGASGTFAAGSSWTLPGAVLAVGPNEFIFTATNTTAGGVTTNAIDVASDAAYSGGWNAGNNGGTGFGGWVLYNDSSAGHFISTNGWGLWSSQSNNLSEGVRPFPNPLSAGQTFSVSRRNNWILEGVGSVGIALRNGSTTIWEFYFNGGDTTYSMTGGNTSIGWTNAPIDIAFTLTSSNTYSVLVTPLAASSMTYTGSFSGVIDNFRAWSYNNGIVGSPDNSNRDYFVNNLKITSPSAPGVVTGSTSVIITRLPGGSGDSNNDGVPDDWYNKYDMNPLTPGLANIDSDGDGISNLHEFIFDTDPTDNTSYNFNSALMGNIAGDIMGLQVAEPTSTGRLYDIFWSTNLAGNEWWPMNLNVPGRADRGPVMLNVTNDVDLRYYRTGVKVPQED
jgi:hypothetical protein